MSDRFFYAGSVQTGLPSKIEWQLDVNVHTDGKIAMTLRKECEVLSRWLIDTREKAIRDALIKLGWTPPGEQRCDFCDAGYPPEQISQTSAAEKNAESGLSGTPDSAGIGCENSGVKVPSTT